MSAWGLPPDLAALLAAALGLFACSLKRERVEQLLLRPSRRSFLWFCAALSCLLSCAYVVYYLRGAPRIIDATSYYLQARTLATGQLSFAPDGPLASFHGRFLHATPEAALSVLFPPGYPVLLAAAVWLGVPLLLGPALGALLSVLTYQLAWQWLHSERSARWAALASCLCATLRYHTADSMSHGWAAVLLLLTLFCGTRHLAPAAAHFELQISGVRARAQREPATAAGRCLPRSDWLWNGAAGVALGWLFATRPLTALTGAVGLALWFKWRAGAWQRWLALGLGAAPVIALYLWHQYALSGQWGQWLQHAYYLAADGPPGCIRIGFGEHIGCRVEHADFVAHYLPHGYGAVEALGTTGRRLLHHISDVSNFELGFLLCVAACWVGFRNPALRALGLCVLTQMVVYAGFYFDGSYPGGGARMFADVLPLEHILLAWGIDRWRLQRWLLPSMLLGFAFHSVFAQRALQQREGGRPMFEAELLPRDTPLVFTTTDHGFNLGFDPSPDAPVLVARKRGDAFDHVLWQLQGRPRAVLYDFEFAGSAGPSLHPYTPATSHRFEAESMWPVPRIVGGWVEPVYDSNACTSGGKALRLHPNAREVLRVQVQVWLLQGGRQQLRLHGSQGLRVTTPAAHWRPAAGACGVQVSDVELAAGPLWLSLEATEQSTFDAFEAVPAPP